MPVASILLSVGDDQASICGATLCARTTNGVPRRTLSVPMAALHQAAACIGFDSSSYRMIGFFKPATRERRAITFSIVIP